MRPGFSFSVFAFGRKSEDEPERTVRYSPVPMTLSTSKHRSMIFPRKCWGRNSSPCPSTIRHKIMLLGKFSTSILFCDQAHNVNQSNTADTMERHHESTTVNTDHNHTNFRTKNDLQLSGIGSYDVLCGRNKLAFNNIGNRRLRVTVSLSLERYLAKPGRQDKTLVIISILKLIQETGGRSLKWKKDRLIELGEKQAREKVGHALRDMASARDLLPSSYAPSLSAKLDILLKSSTHSTSKEKQCDSMPAVSSINSLPFR